MDRCREITVKQFVEESKAYTQFVWRSDWQSSTTLTNPVFSRAVFDRVLYGFNIGESLLFLSDSAAIQLSNICRITRRKDGNAVRYLMLAGIKELEQKEVTLICQ